MTSASDTLPCFSKTLRSSSVVVPIFILPMKIFV